MNTIKIHILHCGSVKVDDAIPFYQKTWHPAPYTGFLRNKKHKIEVPVSAYLIEHKKGLILIDTGWHTDVRINPRKYLGSLHYSISTPLLPEGQAINEQLEKLGYKPEDIDYLILSHLHSDHASGLQLLKNAKKILTSSIELREAEKRKLDYKSFMWEGTGIETFSFEEMKYGPFDSAFDLFGDESILFVSTPGHTEGMCSVLVQNDGKFVLLCSDTGYARKSWETMTLPGMMVNKKKAPISLEWVRQMSEKPNCIDVIANHDPDVLPHTIILD